MKKSKRLIMTCIVMAVIMLLSAVAIFAATYWDAAGGGDISAGSTGGTGNAVPSGYANVSNYPISGLRISIVNSYSGQTRTGCLNFVAEGDGTYLGRKMFEKNYNKVQMFSNWNGGFALTDSTLMGLCQPTNYGAQTFAGFTSESLNSWEENDWNLQVVASLLICGNTSRAGEPLETLLNPGDRIIIEALYPLKINNINYYLTCSEYASMCATAYGNVNAVAGNTSNKGQISFIGQTLNYYWPNGMHAPNGTISDCGIGPAPTLSSQATFWQLISQAYGMHIAYTDARPNNVTFTVNEVFDIVSDDGLSVTGDTQIYSNSFTVTSGSTINIVDYLSTTRLAGNRNGNWPTWPRAGVTISANGTTYSNPWSYRFDGSWANGLTGHSSNVNQQYVIGSDGITITVRYVPNDAHLTIRNKVAIYDQNSLANVKKMVDCKFPVDKKYVVKLTFDFLGQLEKIYKIIDKETVQKEYAMTFSTINVIFFIFESSQEILSEDVIKEYFEKIKSYKNKNMHLPYFFSKFVRCNYEKFYSDS